MKEQQEPNFELINAFLENATLIDKAQLVTLLAADFYLQKFMKMEQSTWTV